MSSGTQSALAELSVAALAALQHLTQRLRGRGSFVVLTSLDQTFELLVKRSVQLLEAREVVGILWGLVAATSDGCFCGFFCFVNPMQFVRDPRDVAHANLKHSRLQGVRQQPHFLLDHVLWRPHLLELRTRSVMHHRFMRIAFMTVMFV